MATPPPLPLAPLSDNLEAERNQLRLEIMQEREELDMLRKERRREEQEREWHIFSKGSAVRVETKLFLRVNGAFW